MSPRRNVSSSMPALSARRSRWRILLIDDHPLMRQGQAALINSDSEFEVCGEASSAAEGMRAIVRLKPDLVILDLTLPDKEGLEVIKDIRALHPNLPLLTVSMHEEAIYATRVIRAGGRGYLMKHEGVEKLIPAMRTILQGGYAVSPSISAAVFETYATNRPKTETAPELPLTDREVEVMRLFGEGWDKNEIAARLKVSSKTVDVHRAHIREKMGFKTVSEFLRFAIQWTTDHRAKRP